MSATGPDPGRSLVPSPPPPGPPAAHKPSGSDSDTFTPPPGGVGYGYGRIRRLERTAEVTYSAYISPADLAAYAKVYPELPKIMLKHNLEANNRVMEAAERENRHFRQMEARELDIEAAEAAAGRPAERRGQTCAAAVAISGFVLCGSALYFGYPWAATGLGCTMIVALVGAFLAGRLIGRTAPDSDDPDHVGDAGPGNDRIPTA